MLLVTVEATNDDDATVVLYGHLDKQPPLGEWSDGSRTLFSRFDGVIGSIARGVADDGYSTFSALLALETTRSLAIPHSRCVVLIEASEESGSPDLDAYLDHLSDRLGRVELMICLDSGALTYDRLWVTTSLRGLANVEVTVEVLTRGQHSGCGQRRRALILSHPAPIARPPRRRRHGEVLVLEKLHGAIPEAARRRPDAIAQRVHVDGLSGAARRRGAHLMGEDVAERILNQTWRPTLSVIGMGGIPAPENRGQRPAPLTSGDSVVSFAAQRRCAARPAGPRTDFDP